MQFVGKERKTLGGWGDRQTDRQTDTRRMGGRQTLFGTRLSEKIENKRLYHFNNC
jgi:hypothetical protein